MSYREKWQELAHELFADCCKPCGDYKNTSEMRACLCSDVNDIIESEFNSQNFTGCEYNNHMNMLMDAMDKERNKDMYGKKQRSQSKPKPTQRKVLQRNRKSKFIPKMKVVKTPRKRTTNKKK
jgi:hypothetical protein